MADDRGAHALEAWLAEARADEAAAARARERWLRQQDVESATLTGLLVDLCEQGVPVTLTTTAGARHHGRVATVGGDFVAISTGAGTTLVVIVALATIRFHERVMHASGEPRPPVDVTLAGVLAVAAGDRARVRVAMGTGGTVTGELRGVSDEVLALTAHGDLPAPSYLRLASVSEVSFLDSG